MDSRWGAKRFGDLMCSHQASGGSLVLHAPLDCGGTCDEGREDGGGRARGSKLPRQLGSSSLLVIPPSGLTHHGSYVP